jgi:hypothetical protein
MNNPSTAINTTIADWAILLRRLGLGIIPLLPRGKAPAIKRWLPLPNGARQRSGNYAVVAAESRLQHRHPHRRSLGL